MLQKSGVVCGCACLFFRPAGFTIALLLFLVVPLFRLVVSQRCLDCLLIPLVSVRCLVCGVESDAVSSELLVLNGFRTNT